MEWLLYILAAMVLYDFSLHVYDILRFFKKTKASHPFGMYLLMNRYGGKDETKRKKVYHIFWTIYWGLAFLIFLIYFCTR